MSYHYFTLSNCCEYALLRISTKKRVFLLTILSMQVNLNWCRILNHDTLSNDDNLPIPAYELIRIDHPSNQKQDAICTYICIYVRFCKKKQYKLFERMLKFQSECKWELCNTTLIYASPSQWWKVFDTFLSNFELLLDNIANLNPFISIIIGDFNARSRKWCCSDKTTYEDKKTWIFDFPMWIWTTNYWSNSNLRKQLIM